jgi:hypothetical protein
VDRAFVAQLRQALADLLWIAPWTRAAACPRTASSPLATSLARLDEAR